MALFVVKLETKGFRRSLEEQVRVVELRFERPLLDNESKEWVNQGIRLKFRQDL